MTAVKSYRRAHAVEYAKAWAQSRNPLFTRFDALGGDCTNFVSQCVFAGSCVMNETPTFGWYYRASGDYAPAWTGVPFFYNFLTGNMGVGPFGREIPVESAEMGDIIQLGRQDGTYYHTLIVTGMRDGVPLICAHDNDALDRPLDTYVYDRARCVHIEGVRISVPSVNCCFAGMMQGTSIFPTAESTAALSCFPDHDDGLTDGAEASDIPDTPETVGTEEVSPQRPADVLPADFVRPEEVEMPSDLSDSDV